MGSTQDSYLRKGPATDPRAHTNPRTRTCGVERTHDQTSSGSTPPHERLLPSARAAERDARALRMHRPHLLIQFTYTIHS